MSNLSEFELAFFDYLYNRDWENIFNNFPISIDFFIKDKNILHYIATHDNTGEGFDILCEKYNENEMKIMAESFDSGGNSIYHLCAYNRDNLKMLENINKIIPAKKYIRYKNKLGQTPIDIAKYEGGSDWINKFKNIYKKIK